MDGIRFVSAGEGKRNIMNKSSEIGNLAKALAIVQSKLQPAKKDSANPFFKSSYADLNSVWDSCRALLSANGLSIAQLNQTAESGVIVETVLMHKSGEWFDLSDNDVWIIYDYFFDCVHFSIKKTGQQAYDEEMKRIGDESFHHYKRLHIISRFIYA